MPSSPSTRSTSCTSTSSQTHPSCCSPSSPPYVRPRLRRTRPPAATLKLIRLTTRPLQESDPTCKRNAFVALCNIAQPRAVEYLLSIYDSVATLDELFQLAVIDLVRREARTEGPNRAKWIRTIFELLNASSHTVKYEAATSLTTLTQNPAAVKAAAGCFVELCVRESDNNVKMIVLDRIEALRAKHEHVLDGLVMEVLRVLQANDMEVKRKALGIALEMVSSRNVEEVVGLLKKQLANTLEDGQYEKVSPAIQRARWEASVDQRTHGVVLTFTCPFQNLEYRQLLIQSIHSCAIKFSEVAASVVHVLMEFIGDSGNSSAVDVISFVRCVASSQLLPLLSQSADIFAFTHPACLSPSCREVVEKFPALRHSITEKLLETVGDVKSGKVFRGALWIVGEYCTEVDGQSDVLMRGVAG